MTNPYGQGGYGQGPYGPDGYGQGGYGPGGPTPPQSPWSSPAVLVAIGAGVLLVVVGVLAALLWIPADDDPGDESANATGTTSTFTDTVTRTAPAPTTVPPVTPSTVPPTTPTTRPAPTVAGADWQGFLDGPRCNAADDPAVAVGQTTRSRVVICQVGNQAGRWYYKGRSAQGDIELQFPTRSGSTFAARNGAVRYLVSPGSLTITEGGAVLTEEPMLAYWSAP